MSEKIEINKKTILEAVGAKYILLIGIILAIVPSANAIQYVIQSDIMGVIINISVSLIGLAMLLYIAIISIVLNSDKNVEYTYNKELNVIETKLFTSKSPFVSFDANKYTVKTLSDWRKKLSENTKHNKIIIFHIFHNVINTYILWV